MSLSTLSTRASLFARWLCSAMMSPRWRGRRRTSLQSFMVMCVVSFCVGVFILLQRSYRYALVTDIEIRGNIANIRLDILENNIDLLEERDKYRTLVSAHNQSNLEFLRQLHDNWNASYMGTKFDQDLRFTGAERNSYKICDAPHRTQYVCPYQIKAYPRSRRSTQEAMYKGSFTIGGHIAFTWAGDSEDRLLLFRINRTSCHLLEVKRLALPEKSGNNITTYLGTVRKGDLLVGVSWGWPAKVALSREFNIPYSAMNELRPRTGIIAFSGVGGYKGFSRYLSSPKGTQTLTMRGNFTFGSDFNVVMDSMPYSIILQKHPDVDVGGHWRPIGCVPHSDIAIIIPYRSREVHLKTFLDNIMTFLKLQNVAFTMFLLEQAEPEMFNRAALMNVGYLEAKARHNFDCYVFHDVDQVPEDLSNLYYCADQPRHLVVTRSVTDYQLRWDHFFGGAIMMKSEHIERINGFPNRMFGWGGEDDDIWSRIHLTGMGVYRYPIEIGRYTSLNHGYDDGNPRQSRTLRTIQYHAQFYQRDGLSSLRHDVLARETRSLFYHVIVRIPGPTTAEEIPLYLPDWAGNETDLHMERFKYHKNGVYIPPGRNMFREGEI